MKKNIKIILLLLLVNFVYADILSIDNQIKKQLLLPYSSVFIDKTNEMNIEDIQKDTVVFEKNDKKLLGFGYSPDFTVWIKFTLKNNTNKPIQKIVVYENSLTTHISFFDITQNKVYQDGLFNINTKRKTVYPSFKITLNPNESGTYYLKASSKITTLIVKLGLYDTDSFYEKEIKHQLILALFFGAMLILGIYNLFIYFFTKDVSYLYYVLYIFGIISHHMMYVGIAYIYFTTQDMIKYIIEFSSVFVAAPVYFLGFFSKYFLQLKRYPKLNMILNVFLVLIPLFVLFFILTDGYDKYRNLLTFSLLIYLMIVTIYSAIKRDRQAYFILFGWMIFLSSGLVMYLSSAGVINFYQYFPYLVETSFVLEAIIFSIALSDRINTLQKDKIDANKKLINQQKNEKERLEIQVDEKTNDLKIALDEKGLLLKELNHRVKNNMQTIVSLIRLQSDEVEDEKYRDILSTIQNRINAMSHLHELLYQKENISHVNAYEYFSVLSDELQYTYNKNVRVSFDIRCELKMHHAIYCGLILNELMTNSFKYAFPNKNGHIQIKLFKEDNTITLIVSDDGVGYEKLQKTTSLGLILVDTLTIKQLKGTINTLSDDGVTVEITWNENE